MNLKSAIQSVIPSFTGKVCAHIMGWYGDGNIHRNVPYLSNDPYVIAKQLTMMQLVGIDIVIQTWQGPQAPFQHSAAQQMAVQCGERGMGFMLLLDPWIAKLGTGTATENVQVAIADPTSQAMMNGPSYVPEKYVLDFTTGANLTTLGTAFPTLKFLAQSVGFSWPMIPWVAGDYAAMNGNPGMKVPGICASFDDSGMPTPQGVTLADWTAAGEPRDYTQSVWGGMAARRLSSQSGQFLLSQLPTIQKGCGYVAVVTWNDYDEQSSGPLEQSVVEMTCQSWND